MKVLVINKNDFAITQRFELPPGFAFHFGNAWQDSQHNIRFDASLYRDVEVLHELSDLMQGKLAQEPSNAVSSVFSLHRNGTVSVEYLPYISEFPRTCEHLTGLRNHLLFHVSGATNSLWNSAVVAHNYKKDYSARFEYGHDFLVEEHVPVCPTSDERHGYLIGTALHVPSKRSCLNIFTMHDIEAGPIARAWLSHHLPLGFHGNFIPLCSNK